MTFTANMMFASFDVRLNKDGFIGTVDLVAKLIAGNYPDYKKVLANKRGETATFSRASLLDVVNRTALVCDDKSPSVKLSFRANQLTVSAISPDLGRATETLPIQYNGSETDIHFVAKYLIDPLRVLTDDELTIDIRDAASPAIIKSGTDYLNMMMPLLKD